MQLPAAQTSHEPQPHRVGQRSRKPLLSQNATDDDGSRLTSEPRQPNAQASQPRLPAPVKQVADYACLLERTNGR
jgi:hypothetical protein